MTEEPELEPCPFCGESEFVRLDQWQDESVSSHATVNYYQVHCDACGSSSGRVEQNKEEAIDLWNTRIESNKGNL